MSYQGSVFFLLVLLYGVFAQVQVKTIIDPFTVDTTTIFIIVNDTTTFPATVSISTQDSSILGGERDLALTLSSSISGLTADTGVSTGSWSVSMPSIASGFAIMQYDGLDESPILQPGGLGSIDFTFNGATSIRATIQSDIATSYTFRVYSGQGALSSFVQNIPGDSILREYEIAFASFTGGADFKNVGALQIEIDAGNNVDTFVTFVGTTGPPIIGSVSATPSPSPSTKAVSFFTWYTVDDDFGRAPCNETNGNPAYLFNDDNIIYYYFYGFDSYAINSASSVALGFALFFLTLILV